MRKFFVVTLGLVTLGASVQLAMARQASCTQLNAGCWKVAGLRAGVERCDPLWERCLKDGSWGNVGGPGSFRKDFKADAPPPPKTSSGTAPPRSQNPTSAGIPIGATVRDHRGSTATAPVAGAPPPAAPRGTVVSAPPSNTADNGPVVRDHRPGGNAENKRH